MPLPSAWFTQSVTAVLDVPGMLCDWSTRKSVLADEDYDGPDLLAPTRLYLEDVRRLRAAHDVIEPDGKALPIPGVAPGLP